MDHETAYGGGAALRAGALLEVAITSVADRRMIGVTSSPAAVAAGVVRDNVATELGVRADATPPRPGVLSPPCGLHLG